MEINSKIETMGVRPADERSIAFEHLVKEHRSTIYSICYMYASDRSEVDDYYQEVLINLWLGFPKFRGVSNVKTWIWRVSINTCITFIRKKKRKIDTVPLTNDIDKIDSDNKEMKQVQMLYNRISKLDRLEKAMILLWLENMNYDEIAMIMGLTVPAVATRLVRIKEKLKSMSVN